MAVDYPAHLYIRVERTLRAALTREAQSAGLSVSELARRELRSALDTRRTRPEDRDPPPAAPAIALRPAAR